MHTTTICKCAQESPTSNLLGQRNLLYSQERMHCCQRCIVCHTRSIFRWLFFCESESESDNMRGRTGCHSSPRTCTNSQQGTQLETLGKIKPPPLQHIPTQLLICRIFKRERSAPQGRVKMAKLENYFHIFQFEMPSIISTVIVLLCTRKVQW